MKKFKFYLKKYLTTGTFCFLFLVSSLNRVQASEDPNCENMSLNGKYNLFFVAQKVEKGVLDFSEISLNEFPRLPNENLMKAYQIEISDFTSDLLAEHYQNFNLFALSQREDGCYLIRYSKKFNHAMEHKIKQNYMNKVILLLKKNNLDTYANLQKKSFN